MIPVQLVGHVVEPRRDRAGRLARHERVRRKQLEELRSLGRLLDAGHTMLRRGGPHLAADLERVHLIPQTDAAPQRRYPRQR